MAYYVKIKRDGVTDHGQPVPIGTVLGPLSEKSGASLVADGFANKDDGPQEEDDDQEEDKKPEDQKPVEKPEQGEQNGQDNGQEVKDDGKGQNAPPQPDGAGDVKVPENNAAADVTGVQEAQEPKKQASALNDKYNRDDLADAAKAVGVEFKYDAKKGEIIQAVIDAGKADVLIQAPKN